MYACVCLYMYRPHVRTPYDYGMYYYGDNSGLTQLLQQQLHHEQHPKHQHQHKQLQPEPASHLASSIAAAAAPTCWRPALRRMKAGTDILHIHEKISTRPFCTCKDLLVN